MASMLLIIAVFVLDVIAFALAVTAEHRRTTAVVVSGDYYYCCRYDSNIATGLGVGSSILLLASQTLIMVVTRCLCSGRALRRGQSRAWAIFLFILCWVFFFIAEVCLLVGSVKNARYNKLRNNIADNTSCETVRKGFFGAGAAFVFFTGFVSELYYVSYSKARDC